MAQWSLCSAYVVCAVVANLAVSRWGASALPYTAFFLIGFDLLSRDALHEMWHGKHLFARMGLLIVCASLVTWLLSPYAGRVAVASSMSFAVSGTVNAIVYGSMYRRARMAKMQVSNVAAALCDSVTFPLIALGSFSWSVSASQALAKIAGGLFWSVIYLRASKGLGSTINEQ